MLNLQPISHHLLFLFICSLTISYFWFCKCYSIMFSNFSFILSQFIISLLIASIYSLKLLLLFRFYSLYMVLVKYNHNDNLLLHLHLVYIFKCSNMLSCFFHIKLLFSSFFNSIWIFIIIPK